jgi:hypothetical protein
MEETDSFDHNSDLGFLWLRYSAPWMCLVHQHRDQGSSKGGTKKNAVAGVEERVKPAGEPSVCRVS